MNLYAESSAVLAWIFREEPAPRVKEILDGADQVFASDLTLVECDRALVRAGATGGFTEMEVVRRRNVLEEAASLWTFLRIDEHVVERARQRFPGEPLRSLDALHLASALALRSAVPKLAVLSLDTRVRGSAADLGFRIVPE